MIIIDPTEVAHILAVATLKTKVNKYWLKDHVTPLSDKEIDEFIFSDGEIKPEHFEDYRDEYDYYFEILTNSSH